MKCYCIFNHLDSNLIKMFKKEKKPAKVEKKVVKKAEKVEAKEEKKVITSAELAKMVNEIMNK